MFLTLALSLLLAFSVFAFGAVEDWSTTVLEVGLFALALFTAWRDKSFLRFPKRLKVPFWIVTGLFLIALLQLVPLPTSFWKSINDERGALATDAMKAEQYLRSPAYRIEPFTGRTLPEDTGPLKTPPEPAWRPTTFTPLATVRAALALLAALAFILLLEKLSENRDRLRHLAWVCGIIGVAVGLVGAAQFRLGVQEVMGFRKSAHATGAFGPFINENNGMGFVNVAFCLLYYLLWRQVRRAHHVSNRIGLLFLMGTLASFHIILLWIRTSEAALWTILLIPVVLLMHLARKHWKVIVPAALLLVLAGAGFTIWAVYWDFTSLHGRVEVWQNALRSGHWLAGNGLATFASRFPAVLTDMPLKEPNTWLYPENEYVQLAFEAGFVGCAASVMGALFSLGLGGSAIRGASSVFLLVPALWGETLHAVTDFTLHIWPNALAFLLAIALISARLDPAEGANHNRVIPSRPIPKLRLALASLIVAACCMGVLWSHLAAISNGLQQDAVQRSSYAPLVQAEETLQKGQLTRALDAFLTVFHRAVYEGEQGTAEQVRWRIGIVGQDLVSTKLDQAWPFLESYALLSQDFSQDSSQLENYVLLHSALDSGLFAYNLLRPDGLTQWGERPVREWARLWPLMQGWKNLSGKELMDPVADRLLKEDTPEAFVLHYSFALSYPKGAMPADIRVVPNPSQGPLCSLIGPNKILSAHAEGKAPLAFPNAFSLIGGRLDAVGLSSHQLSANLTSITLVREYPSL